MVCYLLRAHAFLTELNVQTQPRKKKVDPCFIFLFMDLMILHHGNYRIIYVFLRKRLIFTEFTEIADKIFYRADLFIQPSFSIDYRNMRQKKQELIIHLL